MKLPFTWTDPTAALSFPGESDVEIQIVGTPSVAYTPERSVDGSTFVACNAYDKDGIAVASLSAAGIYSIDGCAWVKLTGGSDSVVKVVAN